MPSSVEPRKCPLSEQEDDKCHGTAARANGTMSPPPSNKHCCSEAGKTHSVGQSILGAPARLCPRLSLSNQRDADRMACNRRRPCLGARHFSSSAALPR